MSGNGLSVVTMHRRQHVRGSMAWTAGDLPGDSGVRDDLSGSTTPPPATTYPGYTANIDGVVSSGRVTMFPGKNPAWSDRVGSTVFTERRRIQLCHLHVISLPPKNGFCGRIKLHHQHNVWW
ncbi:hypothetical protein TIFTF001_015961 [Ficus carica]|uniref:Uncharacterized protein n=1 Tax=Ficus carica TaxID=3494 RepID=A0AA88A285_FICCA|nr:hypothetical protein TIFTF001_015961 [Ficus carica]